MTSICGAYIPPAAALASIPQYVDYDGICYISKSTFEYYGEFYSKFSSLGNVPKDDVGEIPVIGIDPSQPVAVIINDDQFEEMLSYVDNSASLKVIPFIVAIVAIDAGLIATMWAAALP